MRVPILLGSCVLAACAPPREPAEILFVNGRFVTLDESTPEAEAIAVRDGRILAVGTREEIEKHRRDDTEIVDLEAAQPLSARATAGFLSRTERGSLRFVDGFIDDVAEHAVYMAEELSVA